MPFTLRNIPRVNYYESEDIDIDGNIFCDLCGDYVFEYCSIHGPLLVIPDDKVPTNSIVNANVPRPAFTIPSIFLHVATSTIPGAGIGVFATLTLPRGVRFGPYDGKRVKKGESEYCWQVLIGFPIAHWTTCIPWFVYKRIYDSQKRASHVIDAGDETNSNWMRYVNCARHWQEQNLIAYQYQGHIYYRTVKIIPRFTELLVFYGSEFANLLHIDLKNYNSPTGTINLKLMMALVALSYLRPIYAKNRRNIEEVGKVNEELEKYYGSRASRENKKAISGNRSADEEYAFNLSQIFGSHTVGHNNTDAKIQETISNTGENTYANLNESNIFICDKCHVMFRTKLSLIVHLQIHTQNVNELVKIDDGNSVTKDSQTGRYHCPICEYNNLQRYKLLRHMIVHSDEKKFTCEHCMKKFATKYNLKRHYKTHSTETTVLPVCKPLNENMILETQKKLPCPICGNTFTRNNSLKRHLLTVHYGKRVECPICAQKFCENSSLKRHMLSRHLK